MNNHEHFQVIQDNYASYHYYKKTVDKYLKLDSREINFQNRVIVCMLEKILVNTDIEVVDSSTLYYRGKKNSKTLDNFQFMKKGFAPPDLLLVRNWNIDNINNKVQYLAAIEIKSPNSKTEKICGISFENYNHHLADEINSYLSTNCEVVILTDCYRWQFFDKNTGFIDTKPIDLVDKNKHWKHSCLKLGGDIVNLHELDKNDEILHEPDEWNELQKKILSLLKIDIENILLS